MLGQFENDYWGGGGEWQGPVQYLDYGPPAPMEGDVITEPTIPDFAFEDLFGPGGIGSLEASASVGPDISFGQGVPLPEVGQVDVFSGMFDNIPMPTFEEYQAFNEPGGEDEGFFSKLWEGIKDFGKNLQFGGGGGSAGGTAPIAQGMPQYPSYGPTQGGGLSMGTVALLGAGAVVLFALTKGKR